MAYVAPLIYRLDGLAALPEVTYGTDPVPTAVANAIRPASRVMAKLRIEPHFENLRDDFASGSMVPLPPGNAAGWKGILTGFEWSVKGKGAAYTGTAVTGMIEADPLFQASGWVGTYSATPTPQYTYAPITSGLRPSAAIYVWGEGKLFKLTGCRSRMRILFPAGKLALAQFDIEGYVNTAWVDATLPSNFDYNVTFEPPAVSQAVSIGGIWAPDFETIQLDSGNPAEWLESGNQPSGLQGYDYGFVAPELRVSALSVAQATYEPLQDKATIPPTSRSVALSLNSGVQYNRVALAEATAYVRSATKKAIGRGFNGWDVLYRLQAPTLLFN